VNIPNSQLPRVVIIGGGFAGLNLAKFLNTKEFQVVLLDKHNYHTFQPLLYQVATAGLEASSIAYPLRKIFQNKENVFFRLAEVNSLDTDKKNVHTNIGSLEYDTLVVATGSTTNFFGNDQIAELALSMKSVTESLDIRSLVLENFERAILTQDLSERESLMNVVIVGGGPTGVELAGALAELKRHVLPRDYPELDVRQMNIHLIEAAPRVLAAMSEKASQKAGEFLSKMGVSVWTDTRVLSYDGLDVMIQDGKPIKAKTVIWAAGVQGCPIQGIPAEKITRGDRIEVNPFNQVEGLDGVYALGDTAQIVSEDTPRGHPMVAQVAIQQGKLLAKNLLRIKKSEDPKSFIYKDLGSMATIGRNKAVVDLPNFEFQGFLAWFVWMGIHMMQLIGFRNKLIVVLNWMYNYLRYARDIRLIIRPYRRN
jgi:NADH dehydrogenase